MLGAHGVLKSSETWVIRKSPFNCGFFQRIGSGALTTMFVFSWVKFVTQESDTVKDRIKEGGGGLL